MCNGIYTAPCPNVVYLQHFLFMSSSVQFPLSSTRIVHARCASTEKVQHSYMHIAPFRSHSKRFSSTSRWNKTGEGPKSTHDSWHNGTMLTALFEVTSLPSFKRACTLHCSRALKLEATDFESRLQVIRNKDVGLGRRALRLSSPTKYGSQPSPWVIHLDKRRPVVLTHPQHRCLHISHTVVVLDILTSEIDEKTPTQPITIVWR